jgi:2-polyprenyl-3-methyl-5-hydroxy-6-metoxy-1,4-benzoquinol methylase
MALDPIQQAARDQFEKQSANYGRSHILANTDDIASALSGIDIPRGAAALDVATGGGHTAIYLARLGCRVTATDILRRCSTLPAS